MLCMDLEVVLKKNLLLEWGNKKLSESPHFLIKRLVIRDFLSVEVSSNPNQLAIKFKWSLQHLPFVKGISNINLRIEEGEIPQVSWKWNHFIVKGWKIFLNQIINEKIRVLNLQYPNIWTKLDGLVFHIGPIQVHKDSILVGLMVDGRVGVELYPDLIPILHHNKVEIHLFDQPQLTSGQVLVECSIFNEALRKLSKKINIEDSTYLGISLGLVLLKLEEGQIHIITQIKHPFRGYMKTSCGIVLEANSGKLLLKDVNSKLETNNFLAHMAHLSFKKSLHQLIVNRLEQLVNSKIKEDITQLLMKIGNLKDLSIHYQSVKIEKSTLTLTIKLRGGLVLYPSLLNKG